MLIPVNRPVAAIVAIPVDAEDQVPPVMLLASIVVVPVQTDVAPVIFAGAEITLTVLVA